MPSRLTLVTSDSPEVLARRLAVDLSDAPPGPFEHEHIVVHNYGMRRWVRQELARRHGYAASLELQFPGKFCRDIAKQVTGDEGSTDPRFTPEAMTWRILDLFEQGVAENPDFVAVHRFLGDGDTFSLKLADDIAPGTYSYFCTLHRGGMTGKVVVKAP